MQVCPACGFAQDTPQKDPDALRPGVRLNNRFVVGRELGRGGFGITYVGYDDHLEGKVAIKEYFPQTYVSRMPGQVSVFWLNNRARETGCVTVIREAKKMHKVDNLPAVVKVIDVFYENNTAYIAMGFVDGLNMKDYMRRNGVLAVEQCLTMMFPVLDTMSRIHGSGIIHRDISPDNIMVQPDGTLRILDFGAAKDIQSDSKDTGLVARNGFSPKEQYQTNRGIVPATDVYALCATIYYALLGKVPPHAVDRENEDLLPFPPASRLPEELRAILNDGMRVRIEDRIQNTDELKRRLEQFLERYRAAAAEVPDSHSVEKPYTEETAHSHHGGGGGISESGHVPPLPPSEKIEHVEPTDSGQKPREPVILTALCKEKQEEKPKGLFGGLRSVFDRSRKKAVRNPQTVVVASPDAAPTSADPNATVCADEEGTVLADEEQVQETNAYLLQEASGKRVPISRCVFTLGRQAPVYPGKQQIVMDCQLIDNTKKISRNHAAIVYDGENFYLQDISIKNATYLNGVRLINSVMPEDGKTFPQAYRLMNGDVIQLTYEELVFHMGGNV